VVRRVVGALCAAHAANDGTTVLVPSLLPIAAQLFHIGYLDLGILVAAGYAVNMLVQPVVGRFLEWAGAPKLLALGLGSMAVATIVIADSSSYSSLLLGVVILRFGSSFYHPIGPSVVSKTYSGNRVDKIMGIQSGFGDIGSFLLFVSASLLYATLGWKTPFLIFAAIDFSVALIVFEFLSRVPSNPVTGEIIPPSVSPLSLAGVKGDTSDPASSTSVSFEETQSPRDSREMPLLALFIATFVTGGVYAIVLNFANSLMAGVYHSVLLANLPVSLWLLAFVFADFSTGPLSRKVGRWKLLVISYAVAGLSMALFSVGFASLPVAALVLVANGFTLAFTAPLIYSEIGTRRDRGGKGGLSLGTVFGLLFSIQVIGSALFSYLGGQISQSLRPVYPFELTSLVLFGVVLLLVRYVRK